MKTYFVLLTKHVFKTIFVHPNAFFLYAGFKRLKKATKLELFVAHFYIFFLFKPLNAIRKSMRLIPFHINFARRDKVKTFFV